MGVVPSNGEHDHESFAQWSFCLFPFPFVSFMSGCGTNVRESAVLSITAGVGVGVGGQQ